MSKIEDPDELQFRQIHPNWLEDGIPSRLAFIPMRKDKGDLSLDRSIGVTAKQSHANFSSLELLSAAVFALTVSEFGDEPDSLDCFASPLPNNPHHSHAAFGDLKNARLKKKSLALQKRAVARGQQFP